MKKVVKKKKKQKKQVKFAPGPLGHTTDGHPPGEGRLAVPVRRLNIKWGQGLTKKEVRFLETFLNEDQQPAAVYAPSIEKLKRYCGLLPKEKLARKKARLQALETFKQQATSPCEFSPPPPASGASEARGRKRKAGGRPTAKAASQPTKTVQVTVDRKARDKASPKQRPPQAAPLTPTIPTPGHHTTTQPDAQQQAASAPRRGRPQRAVSAPILPAPAVLSQLSSRQVLVGAQAAAPALDTQPTRRSPRHQQAGSSAALALNPGGVSSETSGGVQVHVQAREQAAGTRGSQQPTQPPCAPARSHVVLPGQHTNDQAAAAGPAEASVRKQGRRTGRKKACQASGDELVGGASAAATTDVAPQQPLTRGLNQQVGSKHQELHMTSQPVSYAGRKRKQQGASPDKERVPVLPARGASMQKKARSVVLLPEQAQQKEQASWQDVPVKRTTRRQTRVTALPAFSTAADQAAEPVQGIAIVQQLSRESLTQRRAKRDRQREDQQAVHQPPAPHDTALQQQQQHVRQHGVDDSKAEVDARQLPPAPGSRVNKRGGSGRKRSLSVPVQPAVSRSRRGTRT